MPPIKDIIKSGLILSAASVFMWAFMIYPNSFEWEEAGQAEGTVRTLMSNSKVLGQPQINAIIDFDDGQMTVVAVPIKSDVRSGDRVLLKIQQDVENSDRRRYQFLAEVE